MKTTSKKGAKKLLPKSRASSAADSIAKLKKTIDAQARELRQAAEQQAATSEVLKVISRSTYDLQPVLETLIENATRLCGAETGAIFRFDGELLRLAVAYNLPQEWKDFLERNPIHPGRQTTIARVALEHRVVHIPDVLADSEYKLPEAHGLGGTRTTLGVPMLRESVLLGVILIRRTEVLPFTEKQIDLVTTFADQAVIAIENVRLFQELKESLEQQTATSEILGVIASSPTDIQPVLDAVAQNAARLCDATDAQIIRVEGNFTRPVASYGSMPARSREEKRPISAAEAPHRAIIDRQTIHVHDLAAEVETKFPDSKLAQQRFGTRTLLCAPLMREGVPLGAILIRRTEVRPFSDKQIKLLETFAHQAVIAIENVRLFKELQERNAELREALEHQTATAVVLGIISRSPTDVQPVLNAIVESAVRVCRIDDVVLRLHEGNTSVLRAHFGPIPIGRVEISIDEPQIRWIREHGTLHIPDVRAQNDFPTAGSATGSRTFLFVPLRQQGELIGVLAARRIEVHPFTPAQIKLLETFADQAVIAIENVRLFQELKESLEQQTATSEILGVIASSPTDIQPVLDTIAESAARVCNANDASIRLAEGNVLRLAAHRGPIAVFMASELPIDRGSVAGRALVERQLIHIEDLLSAVATEFPRIQSFTEQEDNRTVLVVPLMREDVPIGTILIRRTEVRPFSDKQISLLKTFADQAVIAIENVRLFKELQDRNRDLTEALAHQTATSEILRVISNSPTDVQPVFETIVRNAVTLCDGLFANAFRFDDELLHFVASSSSKPEILELLRSAYPMPPNASQVSGRAVLTRSAIRMEDAISDPDYDRRHAIAGNWRRMLGVPMLRDGKPIGAIVVAWPEAGPVIGRHVELLQTFADQAVIAIENVRLFQELEERNAELREALEHQTATAEVLGIISRSPTDVQPVLDAIVESAARVCGIDDVVLRLIEGNITLPRTHFGPIPINVVEISIDEPRFRWVREHGTLHIPDVRAQSDFPTFGTGATFHTQLIVPLRQQGELIGALNARRTEVRPFTPAQIKLLETFADQAVIAIENVRLFQELEARTQELARSVEELKALGEVGQVVSSTLDLQTVLSTIVGRAVQLSGTDCGIIYEYDEPTQEFRLRASYQMEEELVQAYQATPLRLGQGATGRAAETRVPYQIADLRQEHELATRGMRPILSRLGYQSLLAVPLLFEQKIMGALTIYRRETGSFAPEIVNLLRTFATITGKR